MRTDMYRDRIGKERIAMKKRIASLLLCLVMALSLLPGAALAAPDNQLSVMPVESGVVYVTKDEKATLQVMVTATDLEGLSIRWEDEASQVIEGADGDTYVTPPIQRRTEFTCYATDKYGNEDNTVFTVGPENGLFVMANGTDEMTVPIGSTVTLSVYASADDETDMAYRWYHAQIMDNGYSYGPDELIPGEDSDALSVENVQQRGIYVCVVTDKYGNEESCRFDVKPSTGLKVKPYGSSDKRVQPGETATLRVIATAEVMEGLTYQWFACSGEENVPVPGAVTDTYVTPAITERTEYFCEVTDRYGNSDTCVFCAYIPNSLTVEPYNGESELRINAGESAALQVTATANDVTGMTYQWYDEEDTAIPGAESDCYEVSTPEQTAGFSCRVTDRYGNAEWCYFKVVVLSDADFSGSCGNHLSWTLSDSGVLTVSGVGKMADFDTYDEAEMPPWHNNMEQIRSVSIGLGVTTIGANAFNGCRQLTEVKLPATLTTIGANAFQDCGSLSAVDLPAVLTSVHDGAFESCTALTSVTLPGNVRNISETAFHYCSSLTAFTVKSGAGPYSDVNGLLLTDNGRQLVIVPNGLDEVTIPDSVTTIGEYAFSGCERLTEITIPAGVTELNAAYFLPFGSCTKLAAIRVAEGNPAFSAQNGLLLTADGKTVLECPPALEAVTIPDNVTAIGKDAFSWCSMYALTIPAGVEHIGESAFSFSETLKSILFLGKAPADMAQNALFGINATVSYPKAEEASWLVVKKAAVSEVTWVPWENKQVTVISSLPAAAAPVSVTVKNANNEVVPTEVSGKTLSLAEMPEGTYTVELSQPGCVKRKVTVEVDASTSAIPPVQLVQPGNLNGMSDMIGNETDVTDMQCLFEYLAENEMTGALADDAAYFLAVANVNGDNAVDILDYQALYVSIWS